MVGCKSKKGFLGVSRASTIVRKDSEVKGT